ncbi:transposase [Photobacterium sp. GJ3]|uniref:transposase n=1 Tax=Photobacterium sp. GJ3 TaxID=2829502 RepID=UPI002011D5D8|nr:hypothetical protein [Photobacterium sp. GJ3]
MKVPLTCPNFSSLSKRVKILDISIKIPARGEIRHFAIDATGKKLFGKGKMKKRGKEKRRFRRKFHLAIAHQVICAELSLSTVTDREIRPTMLNQTYRQIKSISDDGAYDTKRFNGRRHSPLFRPDLERHTWSAGYPRNVAVGNQRIHGSNEH